MMKKSKLTKNEKLALYGSVKYPNITDKKLSEKLDLKQSTLTSIRHRLRENEYFRTLALPSLQNLGGKMLAVTYTNFSPLIPLSERVKITGETIEVFEEIFFSVGELDKGFSLSISKDYATVGKINDIRTQTFGGRGLLEEKYPNMVIFPFKISKIHRFFDFAPLLKKKFDFNFKYDETVKGIDFSNKEDISFSDTEKKVYCMLLKYPELSDSSISSKLSVSRHTISRLRKSFEQNNLIRKINLPDIKKLGFEILALYHVKFDLQKPPDMEKNDVASLLGSSTIFLASRMFEAVMISVYQNYDEYKEGKARVMHILKENKWIAVDPLVQSYGLSTLIFIKDFKFAPIAKKITGCNLLM